MSAPAVEVRRYSRLSRYGVSGLVLVGAVLALLSVALATPVVIQFLETGLVERIPTAVLATGVMLVAVMSFVCGLILDTVTRGRRELKRMHYLLHGSQVAGRLRKP